MSNHFKSLYRSPLKIAVTLLLLAAAAFLFLYNLGEYAVSDREYREAREKYEGVLTVEEQPVQDIKTPFDFFLLTDDTGRTDIYGKSFSDDYTPTYENTHQQSLGEDLIEKLSALPHISQVEKRYLTAGVSPEYTRLDTDIHMNPFSARAVLTATVKRRFISQIMDGEATRRIYPSIDPWEYLILEDIDLLAGDPTWLMDTAFGREREEHAVELRVVKDEYRGIADRIFSMDYDLIRSNMFTTENHVYTENMDFLQPGRRYVTMNMFLPMG